MNNRNHLHDTVEAALTQECQTVSEESKRVLSLAGDAVNLVKIDEKLLKRLIADIAKRYEDGRDKGIFRGIINPFLGIFGLKLVARGANSPAELVPANTALPPVINADSAALRQIFHDIALEVDALAEDRRASREQARDAVSHLNTAVRDAENVKNRLSVHQSENARSETESLKYIQRMLAERGRDNPPSADEAFGQLLEELGVTFHWDPAGDPAAFQVYDISDESRVGIILPCLMKDESVAVKGLVYTLKS